MPYGKVQVVTPFPGVDSLKRLSSFVTSDKGISTIVTCLVLCLSIYSLALRRHRRMQLQNAAPLPFLALPPELRIAIYENLLEDPYYPPRLPEAQTGGAPMDWMLPRPWTSSPTEAQKFSRGKTSNLIFLANKQIYMEFMDVVCRRTTFHLTVSPRNYTPPASPSSTGAFSASASQNRMWRISPATLKRLRRCDINLVTTSNMLGATDPRHMKPHDWALAKQLREELHEAHNVHELNLHVKAIGDPLWNPLWMWYHASQSLKTMGSSRSTHASSPASSRSPSSCSSSAACSSSSFAAAGPIPNDTSDTSGTSGTEEEDDAATEAQQRCSPHQQEQQQEQEQGEPSGPRLTRITFSIVTWAPGHDYHDSWSPGENHLVRDAAHGGGWAWYCMQGHCVGSDGGLDVPVREFCARLYMQCRTCRPELESEDEREW